MDFVHQAVESVLSRDCAETLIAKQEFFDPRCLQLLISKLLGYAIVAGAVGLKVPQILAILKAQNAKGISVMSYLLEVTVFIIATAYALQQNYPFSLFGDLVAILIQDFVILFLMALYAKKIDAQFFIYSVCAVVVMAVMFGGFLPAEVVVTLQSLTIPLSIASRVPQIYKNFADRDTGSLSFLTYALNSGGALARVFTTITETDDRILLLGYAISTILNGIIAFQIIFYCYLGKPPVRSSSVKKKARKAH